MTTKQYADGVKQFGWQPFHGRLWQRNYYEHIVRNDQSWHLDRENIHATGTDPLDAEWFG